MEHIINKYIKLRLEGKRTSIFINGKRFIQCKKLLLDIQKKSYPLYDQINSIDDAVEIYKTQRDQNDSNHSKLIVPPKNQSYTITPEQEFWGHCSNLDVWAENGYDSRLLHSNLSFPLLEKLAKVGDPQAKKVFKEEIAERFINGNQNNRLFLFKEGYLKYLNNEQLQIIAENVEELTSKKGGIVNLDNVNYFSDNRKKIFDSLFKLSTIIKKFYFEVLTDKNFPHIKQKFNTLINDIIHENITIFTILNSIWSKELNLTLLKTLCLKHFINIVFTHEYENPRKILKSLILPLDNQGIYGYYSKKILFPRRGDFLHFDISIEKKIPYFSKVQFLGNLSHVKDLNLMHWGLKNIEGIDRFENLEKLELSCNEITDLSPLLNCKNLKSLNFRLNPIKNLKNIIKILLHIEQNKRKKANKRVIQNSVLNEEIITLVKCGVKDPREIATTLDITDRSVYSRLGHLGIYEYMKKSKGVI